jgi:hypothetical protein
MKYRIETVSVPVTRGVASPGAEARDLGKRRIVHVLDGRSKPGGEFEIDVLTEEDSA